MLEIWFWQVIISPHMADLAVALARRGCKVTYVAQQTMSDDRARQGWMVPTLPGVALQLAENSETVKRLVSLAPADSIHICQGVRANGSVGLAQTALAIRGLRQWVVMETVNDSGWRGALKRLEYSRIFRKHAKSLQGVLATGYRTADWIVARGMPADRVFPFAYFLPDEIAQVSPSGREPGPYRFIFAGRLIALKRVDYLINALSALNDQDFELWIVGAGPEEAHLRALNAQKLDGRVRWFGQLSLPEVPSVMAQADCLVLPSVHDGWGAVASEALMVGTPVICSEACGVAGVVRSSDFGATFPTQDFVSFVKALELLLSGGPVIEADRKKLKSWASCLGTKSGAVYLEKILATNAIDRLNRPLAPWLGLKND